MSIVDILGLSLFASLYLASDPSYMPLSFLVPEL